MPLKLVLEYLWLGQWGRSIGPCLMWAAALRDHIRPNQVAQRLNVYTRNLWGAAFESRIDRDILTYIFIVFLYPSRIIPDSTLIMPQSFPSKSFSVPYAYNILPFDAIRGSTIKFANWPQCACRDSGGQKSQYVWWRWHISVLSGVYYCLSVLVSRITTVHMFTRYCLCGSF
jgi:hypothetical protein